ncbi:hypothetical protein C6A86_008910 [Mycobacterium sp. ITM-2016-00316]|uniref:hypothetical protein n=1 Tax=Mycobacterium sp. ITM-2016-00316 TaxID=2099695 RepID=UPI000CF9D05A|nr:hypothetical protein [Mycobacterium sp. ITM-2016-00316]WNG83753.1 hypothetical protein C6A86_008910 [Mycobacterium sp. ITM-2016-00316]
MSVTPADLTGTERAVLLVLMAESRPVPNPDLIALGPRLEKAGRDKLNSLGLIESDRTGGRFVHELTDRGWRVCRDILSAAPPAGATGPAKTLGTILHGFERYLHRADLSLADVFWPDTPSGPADRIRDAYTALAARPGAWVALATLRAQLDDLPRTAIDDALGELYRAGAISLIPEENQKVLTPADRAAALEVGNQAKHLISIEA